MTNATRGAPPLNAFGHETRTVKTKSAARAGEPNADGSIPFRGHAAVFEQRSWIGSKKFGFWEQVGRNAFDKTVNEADVRFLIDHNPTLLLARTKSGTLRLSLDEQGLVSEADMAPTSYAKDLAITLARGDVSSMSFAFDVIKDSWEELDDGSELRTLLEVRLWDTSVVTYPAYDGTDAGLRAAGFDVLSRSMGLDAETSARVVAALTEGTVEPDLAPIIRSAAHRLEQIVTPSSEPGTPTRDEGQPAETTGIPLEDAVRRHRHNQRRYGIPA